MKKDVTISAHSRLDDAQLQVLAKSFADLPEIEWTAGPFADGFEDGVTRATHVWDSGNAKHIHLAPRSNIYAARFVFRTIRVNLVYAKHDQLDELMRFTDALTYKLWPYRERGRDEMLDSAFNFSIRDTEIDLEEWTLKRPDVIELLDQLIARLVELGIVRTPAQLAEERSVANVHSKTHTRTLPGKIKSLMVLEREMLTESIDERLTEYQALTYRTTRACEDMREIIKQMAKQIAELRACTSACRDDEQTPKKA